MAETLQPEPGKSGAGKPGATTPETRLLRQPDFRRFFLSRLAGTAAGQMLLVALGWQMYDLTGSAWDLGLVGLAQFVPALLLALPAAGFTMRMFIIFHDAGHGSFFPSRMWNDFIGIFTGIFLLTPYWAGRPRPALHYAPARGLQRRRTGHTTTINRPGY